MSKGKNTGEVYDWHAIRTEYITSRISVKDLAKKHGIRLATVSKRSSEEGWVALRKLFIEKTIHKTIEKESTKAANKLSKELKVADKISDVLEQALNDAEQFRRHIVQDKWVDEDGGMSIVTTERVFEKYDMRSLQQAMSALKMVEDMKRSILKIQTMTELNRQKNEERKLEMDERRLQLEELKAGRGTEEGDSGGVVLLSDIKEDDDEECIDV